MGTISIMPAATREDRAGARLDPVEIFRPWEDDEKKAVRRRLLKARNISCLRAGRTGNTTSRRLFWEANAIANRWCFAFAETPDLHVIADSLVRLFLVATSIERLEAPDGD